MSAPDSPNSPNSPMHTQYDGHGTVASHLSERSPYAPDADVGTTELSPQAYLLPDGTPDWALTGDTVPCSLCGYNLFRMTRPQCPECGLAFDWVDVLNRAVCGDERLFEFSWNRRPVRSFLGTLFRSLRPFQFWSQLSPHGNVQHFPLLLYVAICALIVYLAHATSSLIALWLMAPANWVVSLRSIVFDFREQLLLPTHAFLFLAALQCFLYYLMIHSMNTHGIRPVQRMRVVAYTFSSLYIHLGFMLAFAHGVLAYVNSGWWWLRSNRSIAFTVLRPIADSIVPICIALMLPIGYMLFFGMANKYYLRLPRPWLVTTMHCIAVCLLAMFFAPSLMLLRLF